MKPVPKKYDKSDIVLVSNNDTKHNSWAEIVKKNIPEVTDNQLHPKSSALLQNEERPPLGKFKCCFYNKNNIL